MCGVEGLAHRAERDVGLACELLVDSIADERYVLRLCDVTRERVVGASIPPVWTKSPETMVKVLMRPQGVPPRASRRVRSRSTKRNRGSASRRRATQRRR